MRSAWHLRRRAWSCSTSPATRSWTRRRWPRRSRPSGLRKYVTDFPSERLAGNPDVVALPHLGASTEEAEENCALMVVDQLRAFLEEGAISNSVNFPTVDMSARVAAPHRDLQLQRAQHARPDFHYDGASKPEHPQHGQQVERGDWRTRLSISTAPPTPRSSIASPRSTACFPCAASRDSIHERTIRTRRLRASIDKVDESILEALSEARQVRTRHRHD